MDIFIIYTLFFYPGPRGFSRNCSSRERARREATKKSCEAVRREREKPLVTLALNLTFMQTTAVKRIKLLLIKVTNGNLANTCLSEAICLSRDRPGEINGMNSPSPLGW